MQLPLMLLRHCDQKADDLNHGLSMQCLADQDLLQVTHQVRDQSEHTQVSAISEFVENHFPTALQLASLQLIGAALLNE